MKRMNIGIDEDVYEVLVKKAKEKGIIQVGTFIRMVLTELARKEGK